MKRRDLALNLAVASASLLFIGAIAEVGIRTAFTGNLNPFEPDPQISYRLKSDFNGLYPRSRVRTNSHGHRVPIDSGPDSSARWLFIGDSVTFGFGRLAEESFPYVFGKLFADDPLGAVNAGVPGYNLQQALGLLREALARRVPERIIYGLTLNDVTGASHMVEYQAIDPQDRRSREGGLLGRSMLVGFVQRRWSRLTAPIDPLDAQPAGGAAALSNLEVELQAERVEAFDQQWASLDAIGASTGIPVDVIVMPVAAQLEPDDSRALQRFMATRCEQARHLSCIDALPRFLKNAGTQLFNRGSSHHLTPYGHRVVAELLIDSIRDEP